MLKPVCLALCVSLSAQALDLKVDLPPRVGTEGAAEIDPAQSIKSESIPPVKMQPAIAVPKSIPKNVKSLAQKPEPISMDLPPMPSLLTKRQVSKTDMLFPSPSCLTQNVTFWSRVYSEVRPDQAIVHDRDQLGIVYDIVTLPKSGSNASGMVRDIYSGKLTWMAQTPRNEWDSAAERIAHAMKPNVTPLELLGAAQNVRAQVGLKDRFEDGVQRSLALIPKIHEIINAAGLPTDIVYLPHVESSYVSGARSKVGASGLWQIMPNTMRQLLGSAFVDKRHELEPSTLAAAKLLRQNFALTKSWPLALTAYNHGVNGILRAVKQTGSTDLCTIIQKYESPSFQFASSNFYAQFLAARQLASQKYAILSKGRGIDKTLITFLSGLSRETQ